MKLFFLLLIICFINPYVGFGKCDLEQETKRTPFVVEAEIVKVYESPQKWSESAVFSYQSVKYKVQKVIKGENISEEIIVKHAVIDGSLASDQNKIQLSPTYFSIGEKLILFLDVVNTRENLARTEKTEFVSIDDECSIYLKTENSKRIENNNGTKEKLVKNKPSVYITFEKFGKRKPIGDDESEDKVWLRIYNNTRWSINFCIFNFYDENGNETTYSNAVELGINYEVERILESLSGIKTGDSQKTTDNETIIPRGMPTIHTCSLYELASGESALFNVERRELSENLRIKIKFSFDWEKPTDFSTDIPIHFVYFRL